ncbi:MAG: NTP transferase domain-containing protein [Conexivisphaerales archaeon]
MAVHINKRLPVKRGLLSKPIYLMVLAAGLSSRPGRNKLVETVDGTPLVERAVRAGQAKDKDCDSRYCLHLLRPHLHWPSV